jgi:hypothetical protein
MKKMSGAEYTAFISADWDKLLGVTGAYMDGHEITVDGEDEPSDHNGIPAAAKVVIHCGRVMADQPLDLSLDALYNRWKKSRTVTTLCIEVPNGAVDAIKKAVADMKGKVMK